MRILFVTPYPPSRVYIRSQGFIQHLAAKHDVTVLALAGDQGDTQDARELQRSGARVVIIEEPRWQRMARSVRALPGQLPLQVAHATAPALRAALKSLLRSQRFDVLHVESLRALEMLPESIAVPVVWDAVDCISRLYEQGAQVGATWTMRLIGGLEAQRTREYEQRQIGRFRHILVTSERDRQAFLALADAEAMTSAEVRRAEITVLPHGVDRTYFRPYTGTRDPATLIFSGKMGYHANVAGAVAFIEQVLPRIWASRPDVRLIIAGRNPPAQIRRLASDQRIIVTGCVPDLRPYVSRAWVAISPLPYAVGIQNKALEAMALGTPVVASACAAAGLLAEPGRDLLVADDPAAFAAAVLRLLADEALWRQLAARGLEYIAAHHDWDVTTSKLIGLYARAAASRTSLLQAPTRRDATSTGRPFAASHDRRAD